MKKFKIIATILAVASLLLCEFACGADAIPSVESFYKDPSVHFAVLSPKGHYVAILSTVDGYQVLSVRETGDLSKFTVASASHDNQILAAHWANEDRLVFDLKNTHLVYHDGNTDTYAVNRDGSGLTELISGSWEHRQQNTGSNIVDRTLTADFAFFASTHDGSGDIIVRKFVFNLVDNTSYTFHLFRLNTKTKRLTELMEGNQPANVYGWLLDEHDVPRLAMAQKDGQCITSYFSLDTKSWEEITHVGCFDRGRLTPIAFENRDSLFVSSSDDGFNAVYRYDLKSRKRADAPFLSVKGFDFSGSAEVDRTSNKVLGFHYTSDATASAWLDPEFAATQKKIDAILTQTINTVHCGSDCSQSPALLVKSASDRQPEQYFIYTVADGKIVGLGGAHPDIKPAQMGMRDFYHYEARDGMSIPVYVTKPAGKAVGPQPTIVLVHGGPNVRGASWEWERDAQFLASRGYLVIEPQFRGTTGFGSDLYRAGFKQWGLTMQDDLADAATWAIKKGWSDPKRVGIMGASYGGYATLTGLIKNPELFRCGVEWAGVTDINMMFSLAQSDATRENLEYGMRTTIGDPTADAKQFAENSPLNHAAKLTQPLLMAHGGLDKRVPIAQATAFYNAVTHGNKHVEWIVYNDEGHGWRLEQNNIDFWKHVEVFLDKNLKNVVE